MKFYEYIKEENKRTAKIFGFPVMEKYYNYTTGEKYQDFFGGIVRAVKVNSENCNFVKKEIKILGKSFLRHTIENNCKTFYLLNKEFYKLSLIKDFKNKYLKLLDKKHDDIYIIRSNSGEAYLTLTYIINILIKRNNSKNPLLFLTQGYHIDLVKMICPEIPFVYAKDFKLEILNNTFNIDNFRFFLLFDDIHFKNVENKIKSDTTGTQHYFKSILEKLAISENDLTMRQIKISDDIEKSMMKKVSKTGLNQDNFVFLAPEARTCKLIDESFWESLINNLQEQGYDIFVNLANNDMTLKNSTGYKTCSLKFSEAFSLAQKAKKIITLRSGFSEILSQTGVPMDILYTKFQEKHIFNKMDVKQVMSGFGISILPNINKSIIREIDTSKITVIEYLNEYIKN